MIVKVVLKTLRYCCPIHGTQPHCTESAACFTSSLPHIPRVHETNLHSISVKVNKSPTILITYTRKAQQPTINSGKVALAEFEHKGKKNR